MTVYAMSSHRMVTVGEGHGGCGVPHLRPVDESGYPVQPWAISCPACESYLRTDPQWSVTIEDIVPTYDEQKASEKWAVQGAKDQQAILTAAVARLAGFGQHQLPESLQHMMSKLRPGLTVAGNVVCPACQNSQPAGGKFCRECAAPMASAVPAASINAGPPA